MSNSEQNKTEEPTPFKLKKAREKGNVPKGQDLPFLGTLVGLAIYIITQGRKHIHDLQEVMRNSLSTLTQNVDNPNQALLALKMVYMPSLIIILGLGAILFITVLLIQAIQIRGFLFTSLPLKPDFSKLNPGKGIKRIFSVKTLKDSLKNILKMSVYLACTYFVVIYCIGNFAPFITDGSSLSKALYSSGMRLLFLYMVLALFFSALDQIIVRKEYTKQMRMSKSELQREHKDREGEPRLKQKRKQLHSEFIKQTESLGQLAGSDMLIVNPQHYAVALSYQEDKMSGPQVTTKGRNRFALMLKEKARNTGIPIFENPPLARHLFFKTKQGHEIPSESFKEVADLYISIYSQKTC